MNTSRHYATVNIKLLNAWAIQCQSVRPTDLHEIFSLKNQLEAERPRKMKTLISLILACLLIGPSLCLASPEPQVQVERKAQAKKPVREHLIKTHHYEVGELGGKFVFWRLVRTKDRLVRHTHYPYGKEIVSKAGAIKKYSVIKFHALLRARMKALNFKRAMPAKKAHSMSEAGISPLATSPTPNTGLALGYNQSTGYIPTSTCYNATTSLNNGISHFSFSSTGASSSFASQTNVSSSINTNYSTAVSSGSVGDVFTYGNSYSTTGASGSVFYTAYQLYTANNTYYSINQTGKDAQASQVFSTDCGTYFVSSIPVGMLITGQASYYASTSAGSTDIANSFSGNASGAVGSLENFSAAVSNAYSSSNLTSTNNFSFGFTTEVIGGGEGAAAVYTVDMTSLATPYLESCSAGNTASCTSFVAGANNAALYALSSFQAYFSNTTTPTDLSGLAAFPNGVSGVAGLTPIVANESVATLASLDTSSSQYSDLFTNYKAQLTNYLSVLNQISTLYARAMYLGNNNSQYALGVLSTTSDDGNASGTMNPSPFFDIQGAYFSTLINTYSTDIKTMQAKLSTCLGSTASNVTANCSSINEVYNYGVTSAYKWYSTPINGSTTVTANGNTIAQNNFALQNVIALQYTGLVSISDTSIYPYSSVGFPLDVMWVSALPTVTSAFGAIPSGVSDPSGLPAIIGFADQRYPFIDTGFTTSPYVLMIPATSSSISTISTPITNYSTFGYNIGTADNSARLGWQVGSFGAATSSYLNGCSYPTATNLCAITTTYTGPSGYNFAGAILTATFSAISNFFGN